MLYYELGEDYIFIDQDEHGRFSGRLAQHFKRDYFYDKNRAANVLFAIENHDRAWIGMDETPLWNDEKCKPYSFIDLPKSIKLVFYKKGIDEVEAKNQYAAILCSQHYQDLVKNAKDQKTIEFIQEEKRRVCRLKEKLGISGDKELKEDLDIVKLFDNLSLFVCLQEGKTESEKNFKFFKDGIYPTFECMGNQKIKAQWLNNRKISLDPFPFTQEIQVPLKYKRVSKEDIKSYGVARAYKEVETSVKMISFIQY